MDLTNENLYDIGFGNWVGLNCQRCSITNALLKSALFPTFLHFPPPKSYDYIISNIFYPYIETIHLEKWGYICYNLYMPSQNTKWYKDVQLIQYLDDLRQRNYGFMAKCYFCGAKSIGIKAIEEKLYAVCDEHENKQ